MLIEPARGPARPGAAGRHLRPLPLSAQAQPSYVDRCGWHSAYASPRPPPGGFRQRWLRWPRLAPPVLPRVRLSPADGGPDRWSAAGCGRAADRLCPVSVLLACLGRDGAGAHLGGLRRRDTAAAGLLWRARPAHRPGRSGPPAGAAHRRRVRERRRRRGCHRRGRVRFGYEGVRRAATRRPDLGPRRRSSRARCET